MSGSNRYNNGQNKTYLNHTSNQSRQMSNFGDPNDLIRIQRQTDSAVD